MILLQLLKCKQRTHIRFYACSNLENKKANLLSRPHICLIFVIAKLIQRHKVFKLKPNQVHQESNKKKFQYLNFIKNQ